MMREDSKKKPQRLPPARGRDGVQARGLESALGVWWPRLVRRALGRRGGASFSLTPEENFALGRVVQTLSRGFTGERALAGAPYLRDPESLAAYLLYYWPVSYLQALAVFQGFLPSGFLTRGQVLDLGSGPSPAGAAAFDCGARRVLAADPARTALEAARLLVRAAGHELDTAVLNVAKGGRPPGGPYDCIYCGHLLNELWPGTANRIQRRTDLVLDLAGCLSDRGRIVIVEPALLSTTRDLLAVRDKLAARGLAVIAPCLRQGPCPCLTAEAGAGATCHADMAWRPPAWYVRLAHRARIGKESLRFSFLVLGKKGSAAGAAGADEYRVVSERMLSKSGRSRYMICNDNGRRTLSAKPAGTETWARTFLGLGRYDRIRVTGSESRENGPGLVPESTLEILK
jgi:hypothetical protein